MPSLLLTLLAWSTASPEPVAAARRVAAAPRDYLRAESRALILDQIEHGLSDPAALTQALAEFAAQRRLDPESVVGFQERVDRAFDRFFPDGWWTDRGPISESDQALIRLLRRTQNQTGLFRSGTVLYDGRLSEGVGRGALDEARTLAELLKNL